LESRPLEILEIFEGMSDFDNLQRFCQYGEEVSSASNPVNGSPREWITPSPTQSSRRNMLCPPVRGSSWSARGLPQPPSAFPTQRPGESTHAAFTRLTKRQLPTSLQGTWTRGYAHIGATRPTVSHQTGRSPAAGRDVPGEERHPGRTPLQHPRPFPCLMPNTSCGIHLSGNQALLPSLEQSPHTLSGHTPATSCAPEQAQHPGQAEESNGTRVNQPLRSRHLPSPCQTSKTSAGSPHPEHLTLVPSGDRPLLPALSPICHVVKHDPRPLVHWGQPTNNREADPHRWWRASRPRPAPAQHPMLRAPNPQAVASSVMTHHPNRSTERAGEAP
jgi:hypothetical protein